MRSSVRLAGPAAAVAHQRAGALLLTLKRVTGLLRPVHALVYRGYGTPERVWLKGRVLERSGVTGAATDDTAWDNLRNMWRRFTAAPIPCTPVQVRLDGAATRTTSDPEGYWRAAMRPARPLVPGWHDVTAAVDAPGAPGAGAGRVLVPPDDAEYMVISDLDDTVLRTGLSNLALALRIVLLNNARTRAPFAGVAAFYQALLAGSDGRQSNPLFYVSSSPWNLYDLLVDFLNVHGIPAGPLLLRAWGLDADASLAGGHADHKLRWIRALLRTYPHLPVVLVGDSGQEDPEIYRQVVREHPGRVRSVYVRDVTAPARDAEVRAIARQVTALGVDFVVVPDTVAAARHAAAAGLVRPSVLGEVEAERDRDATGARVSERLLGAGARRRWPVEQAGYAMGDEASDVTGEPVGEPVAASSPHPGGWRADADHVAALVAGEHRDPHRILGVHPADGGAVVRVWRPNASGVELLVGDGTPVAAERTHDAGLFEARLQTLPKAADYRVRVAYGERTFTQYDAYAFWPTFGDIDLHLAGEGRHEELWRRMGAQPTDVEGVAGTSFAVWAPNARSVRVVGDFNSWDGRLHPMRMLGASGIWELFVPEVGTGVHYKYEVVTAQGDLVTRADPYAFATEPPPGTASRVFASRYVWGDDAWLTARRQRDWVHEPMSIYEIHLGSWRHHPGGGPLGYRDLAHELADYCDRLGFTHVELLPPAEHPFGGSWGYQVTGYFAPTARYGDPDDFRYFVDHLHQRGLGVIVDWVPAHFPRDEWALARFDGTALYEHVDPRRGEHPDWGTLVFNFGRNEVRNFLIANALYWLEELHVDGLRVDAVASMLYLDYSRREGEWVPNAYGGRENLEAVSFLKELNATVYGRNPGVVTVGEESTAWPGVSRPVHLGGLGFGFKWNMGWMHDTLSYFTHDPVHRRWHHNELTFSLMYAWSENYVLALSHDEVVHGKRSLLDKMAGDRWQKFANLRALYGWMWAHPGKQLLFMGGEIGQWREWSEMRELDWYVLGEHDHAGVQRLVADLNTVYRAHPELWAREDDPTSFEWVDANNADENLLSFVRHGPDAARLVCVANLAPVPRHGVRIGMPGSGVYDEVLNTDASAYGGSDVGNLGSVTAEEVPWHGLPASAQLTVPPLATMWLVPRR